MPLTGNAQQIADPDFKPATRKPSYERTHPVVVLDEAHENFHTAAGRYKPFADVLHADGYRVIAGTQTFATQTLSGAQVLVIANAQGTLTAANIDNPPSAFTDAECDAVRDWVRSGGSLLLIADHSPFGATAAKLASRSTTIEYSRDNSLLGDHPITRGVTRVVTFTGQSLSVPAGATALLKFATAYESSGADASSDIAAFREGKPTKAQELTNRAQAVALEYGKGRVVMTGEAAMFSAQVIRFKDEQGRANESKMGMNVPGNDNQTFLLNILHWLTRLEK
jgi:glutamine amidotransferase-like uncharacterized protein